MKIANRAYTIYPTQSGEGMLGFAPFAPHTQARKPLPRNPQGPSFAALLAAR